MSDSKPRQAMEAGRTAFVLDLDGTLVDSVYQHVLAWREALATVGIELAVWKIHRRIGMSGALMANEILRKAGHSASDDQVQRLTDLHARAYARFAQDVRPLPGAKQLLRHLSEARVPWAIATSGRLESAAPILQSLELPADAPVVSRDEVAHAKPDPDLLLAAAERLGMPMSDSVVVGDSVWDMVASRRAQAFGVGLLCGGYGRDELERAGAHRVFDDPLDLLQHLEAMGIRNPN